MTTSGRRRASALRRVQSALEEAGAELEDVVRTRMFVTESPVEGGRVPTVRYSGGIRPVTTMVAFSRLIDPALLVEIEADAVVQ